MEQLHTHFLDERGFLTEEVQVETEENPATVEVVLRFKEGSKHHLYGRGSGP